MDISAVIYVGLALALSLVVLGCAWLLCRAAALGDDAPGAARRAKSEPSTGEQPLRRPTPLQPPRR